MDTLTRISTYLPQGFLLYALVVAAFVGTCIVISVGVQVQKKHRGWDEMERRGKQYIISFLSLMSLLAAGAETLIQYGSVLTNLPHLGGLATSLIGGAVLVHRISVSPAWYKIERYLNDLAHDVRIHREVQAMNVETVPATEAVAPRFEV